MKLILDNQKKFNERIGNEDLAVKQQSQVIEETKTSIQEIHSEVDVLVSEITERRRRDEEERIKNEIIYAKEHFREVIMTERIHNLTANQIKNILVSEELNVETEL